MPYLGDMGHKIFLATLRKEKGGNFSCTDSPWPKYYKYEDQRLNTSKMFLVQTCSRCCMTLDVTMA